MLCGVFWVSSTQVLQKVLLSISVGSVLVLVVFNLSVQSETAGFTG